MIPVLPLEPLTPSQSAVGAGAEGGPGSRCRCWFRECCPPARYPPPPPVLLLLLKGFARPAHATAGEADEDENREHRAERSPASDDGVRAVRRAARTPIAVLPPANHQRCAGAPREPVAPAMVEAGDCGDGDGCAGQARPSPRPERGSRCCIAVPEFRRWRRVRFPPVLAGKL